LIDALARKPIPWLAGTGPDSDVVLWVRVSLSRNLADFPFPSRCSADEKKRVEQRLLNAIAEKNGFPKDGYYSFLKLSKTDQQFLCERTFATQDLLNAEGPRGVLISADQTVSLIINSVDHVRIQALSCGLHTQPAWGLVNKIDDLLRSSLDYAFKEPLGFLTASLWLVGTGLRAEAVLHLPALTMEKSILGLEHELRKKRHVLDGLSGNIRNAPGGLYRLSNGITLGKTEEELLLNFSQTVREVVFLERSARERLMNDARLSLEDRVGRALGLARGARLLEHSEAIELLASLRLGVATGLLDTHTFETCDRLMIDIQPTHLEVQAGRALDELTRNKKRADLFRTQFS